MHRPIFILGSHKSGTSLLRSLLDQHDELFVVPIESHFFEHANYWVDYAIRKQAPLDPLTTEVFRRNVKQWVRHCNRSEDPYADSVAKDLFDIERFDSWLDQPSNDSQEPSQLFGDYMQALHYSLTGEALQPSVRVVEKSVENAEFVSDLKKMFPEARFIHIVRNPYATLVAVRKYKSKSGFPWLGSLLRATCSSYYYLERNLRLIDGYSVVRYEDIIMHPRDTVKRLCDDLALPFFETLLTPTYRGEAWGGNSTSGQQFSGISQKRLTSWQDEITPLELALVNKTLRRSLEKWGYETHDEHASPWLPVRREGLKQYVANRVLLKTGL